MYALYFVRVLARSSEKDLLDASNAYRVDHDESKLKMSNKLNYAAVEVANYACTMHLEDVSGVKELKLERLLHKYAYGDVKSVEMNMSVLKNGRGTIMQKWKLNKGKNENLLGDYTETGIGSCLGSDNNEYWVQIYANKYDY